MSAFSFSFNCPCLLIHALSSMHLYLVLGGGDVSVLSNWKYTFNCLVLSDLLFLLFWCQILSLLRCFLSFIAVTEMCLMHILKKKLNLLGEKGSFGISTILIDRSMLYEKIVGNYSSNFFTCLTFTQWGYSICPFWSNQQQGAILDIQTALTISLNFQSL